MSTIREYVQSNIGETYKKITAGGFYDEQSGPDAVGMKIGAELARFGVVEEDLNGFQRSYIADRATLALVPLAIDWYMVQTRLVDNFSRPAGVTVAGGEVGQNYDRIAALRRIADEIRKRLELDGPVFVGSLPSLAGTGMQTDNEAAPLTIDPLTFDDYDREFVVEYGVAIAYEVQPT